MSNVSESREWAQEMFGHADLGDSRRTRRVIQIAADGAARPGGRVLQVCPSSATRQGAYDFLVIPTWRWKKIQAALTQATTRICEEEKFCFVSIDGNALTLTDWTRTKDFGAVEATNLGARGLKVINAYAVQRMGHRSVCWGSSGGLAKRARSEGTANIAPSTRRKRDTV